MLSLLDLRYDVCVNVALELIVTKVALDLIAFPLVAANPKGIGALGRTRTALHKLHKSGQAATVAIRLGVVLHLVTAPDW